MRIAYDCPRPDCPYQISGSSTNKSGIKETEDAILNHIAGHEASSVTARDNATSNRNPEMSTGAR